MKKSLTALVVRLPLIGRLIRVIEAHSAEIDRMRNTFSADINHMRDVFSADINQIREVHSADINQIREVHSAEINHIREVHSAEINQIREIYSAEINQVREFYGTAIRYLREEFSAHSAATSSFSVALTESVAMRTGAQMIESDRLSALYENLALRVACVESSGAERPAPAVAMANA